MQQGCLENTALMWQEFNDDLEVSNQMERFSTIFFNSKILKYSHRGRFDQKFGMVLSKFRDGLTKASKWPEGFCLVTEWLPFKIFIPMHNRDNDGFEWMYQSDRKISNHLSKHRKCLLKKWIDNMTYKLLWN